MTIQAIPGAAQASPSQTVRKPVQTMDSEVFMQLLVTQLRYQDPSAPMDTNQMMSQSVQLSMMEKMTELTAGSKESFSLQMRTAAAQIIGTTVDYALADGTKGSGTATSVSFAEGIPLVSIGDRKVPLDSITGITAGPSAA
ncbi:flagellar hook assembly protein FlgD [Paenarthrobacter ureafaciens]|uniref:flagellar hook assembly protein FlgD n=1 Tax=Paenarthrobacter ureafaciens TaxID=37931 RepID=UPI001F278993|nr:flagellar hook capping FlgD N-terminal domain-containing protein [Paenarthrobacter ureafaciens]MCX8454259.1 flagellar hook capping protein [Paenarthrobacter ureafaciens]MCY0972465.1 flagellar hook capping protein [Paenarthrobacter ureafaciens]UOD82131.1 flagellar hook capping protein [Paenarthrobacter ureafaciens]WNZ05628.1 flagellar hook capping FlgD N-terminal domain-containing protein [Paenarthrobacter ureafaciens]